MTRAGEDIEFFELSSADDIRFDAVPVDAGPIDGPVRAGSVDAVPVDGGPVDVIEVGAPSAEGAPPTPGSARSRLDAARAQLHGVPENLRVLALLAVLVAALAGFAVGRSGRSGDPAPAAASAPVSATPSSQPSFSGAADRVVGGLPNRSGPAGLIGGLRTGPASCRSQTDVARLDSAGNLEQVVRRYLPAASIIGGTSVVNELGTACSSVLTARVGASSATLILTVTAPSTSEPSSLTKTQTGTAPFERFEERMVTANGWVVDLSLDPASDGSVLQAALDSVVRDPALITSPAG